MDEAKDQGFLMGCLVIAGGKERKAYGSILRFSLFLVIFV